MKIFVAIPSYDPKLQIEVVNSLLNEQKIAIGIGDDITVNILSGDAGIVGARNQLVSNFFDSGFDRMFFLDADITWEPGSIVKLCHLPADFVGGSYRYKMDKESYPITWLPDPDKKGIPMLKHGLVEVAGLPTGFLALSKKVFEKIILANPTRLYEHFGNASYAFFQMFFKDGALVGEDYLFCQEWKATGGKVFLDPEIKLTHWSYSATPHVGHIGAWIKNQPVQLKGKNNELSKISLP